MRVKVLDAVPQKCFDLPVFINSSVHATNSRLPCKLKAHQAWWCSLFITTCRCFTMQTLHSAAKTAFLGCHNGAAAELIQKYMAAILPSVKAWTPRGAANCNCSKVTAAMPNRLTQLLCALGAETAHLAPSIQQLAKGGGSRISASKYAVPAHP